MMRERPILFSAPMVRALLGGRKTQTRRVVKVGGSQFVGNDGYGRHWLMNELDPDADGNAFGDEWSYAPCPYGVTGDRLIVKEAAWMWCERRPNGVTKTGRPQWHYVPLKSAPVRYATDCPNMPAIDVVSPETGNAWGWHKKIGRFLPRWASRITLEVTAIRVERLQAISEEDALAEGITGPHDVGHPAYHVPGDSKARFSRASAAFEDLWCNINGPDSWSANPYVWVVEFRPTSRSA